MSSSSSPSSSLSSASSSVLCRRLRSLARWVRSVACRRAARTSLWAYSFARVLTTTVMSPACPGATSSERTGLRRWWAVGRRCRNRDPAFPSRSVGPPATPAILVRTVEASGARPPPSTRVWASPADTGRFCSWIRQWATYREMASPGKAALRKASKRDCSKREKVLRTWAICCPSSVAVVSSDVPADDPSLLLLPFVEDFFPSLCLLPRFLSFFLRPLLFFLSGRGSSPGTPPSVAI
mmetsp:Transcript_12129/g.28778  ORF Transcript_12129/g.28778 Transcript_12129/m.28778 type:complete len:238 (-) Transcript_12129:129-842(-)